MSIAIEQSSRRTPGFRDGQAIRLADGQDWTFPRPQVHTRPVFAAGDVALVQATDRGADYDALLERFDAAEDGPARIKAILLLARSLLLANYALTDDEVGALLVLNGEPENLAAWDHLRDVAMGLVPK